MRRKDYLSREEREFKILKNNLTNGTNGCDDNLQLAASPVGSSMFHHSSPVETSSPMSIIDEFT